jgi:hypothetical protein
VACVKALRELRALDTVEATLWSISGRHRG